jgi:hypothetical protein
MSKIRLPNKTTTIAYLLMIASGTLIVVSLIITINTIRIISVSPPLNASAVTPQEKTLNQVIELLHGESLAN